jgi:hypothetical protein
MRWKTRQSRLGNTQYEVLQLLMRNRPGVFKPLEPRLERVAKQMTQGVHPWLKTMADPAGSDAVLYGITSDGRSKYQIEKQNRGD